MLLKLLLAANLFSLQSPLTPPPPHLFFLVSVGYEYESCLDVVLWEKRTAVLQGYELDASNMGGWTLDKHHILDVQNGEQTAKRFIQNCHFFQRGQSR